MKVMGVKRIHIEYRSTSNSKQAKTKK